MSLRTIAPRARRSDLQGVGTHAVRSSLDGGRGAPREGAIVYTARSYIGRLITLNHKVLYCSETHPNSPPIEQVYWPENAFLRLHHRNFVGREFKSQRRARRRQKMHRDDDVASVGLQGLDIVLRQNHLE